MSSASTPHSLHAQPAISISAGVHAMTAATHRPDPGAKRSPSRRSTTSAATKSPACASLAASPPERASAARLTCERAFDA